MVRASRGRSPSGRGALARRCHPRLRRALVAPCTTTIRGLASKVVLESGDDLIPKPSAANLDSVESVSVAVLVERLGVLGSERMLALCAALEVAVDCER